MDYEQLMIMLESALYPAAKILEHITDEQLQAMLATVERADSVGFVIDPTQYKSALQDGRLDFQRRMIKLCIHIKAEIAALRKIAGR